VIFIRSRRIKDDDYATLQKTQQASGASFGRVKGATLQSTNIGFFHSARGFEQRGNPHTHSIPGKHESSSDSTINDINCYYPKTHFQSENPFREGVSE
jgi:hypothetical protein